MKILKSLAILLVVLIIGGALWLYSSPYLQTKFNDGLFVLSFGSLSLFGSIEEQRLRVFTAKMEKVGEKSKKLLTVTNLDKNTILHKFDYSLEDMKDKDTFKIAMDDLSFDEKEIEIIHKNKIKLN